MLPKLTASDEVSIKKWFGIDASLSCGSRDTCVSGCEFQLQPWNAATGEIKCHEMFLFNGNAVIYSLSIDLTASFNSLSGASNFGRQSLYKLIRTLLRATILWIAIIAEPTFSVWAIICNWSSYKAGEKVSPTNFPVYVRLQLTLVLSSLCHNAEPDVVFTPVFRLVAFPWLNWMVYLSD